MGPNLAGRPGAEEFAPFYQGYVDRVPGDDPVARLRTQATEAIEFLRNVPEEKREYAYAPEKWTTREVVSHLIDSELVFSYRALRISRSDPQPLAGFDQNAYVENAELGDRPYASLVDELELLRRANVARFSHLSPASWRRLGEANGQRVSVRALAFIMAGHLEHHLEILRQRYGIA